jgi:deoxyadenosine/deoxycytidine kinase
MTVLWISSVEGGTALVERLAQQGSGTPFYEEAAANPFAAIATGSPYAVHHLCTALLLQERGFRMAMNFAGGREQSTPRRKKTQLPSSEVSPRSLVLCDFHPSKSLIGAEYLLSSHEQRELLRTLYRLLRVPEPDLVVYLRAAPDVIATRLRQQNESADVDVLAIERACVAHDTFFRGYKGEKVELDTSSFDYVNDAQALASILKEVPLLYMRS